MTNVNTMKPSPHPLLPGRFPNATLKLMETRRSDYLVEYNVSISDVQNYEKRDPSCNKTVDYNISRDRRRPRWIGGRLRRLRSRRA